MSKYGRKRKINKFLQQSDSDSSYEEKKKNPLIQSKVLANNNYKKKTMMISLDENDDQSDEKMASNKITDADKESENKNAIKKPNARLGVKRGPYKRRGHKILDGSAG